MLDNGNNVLGVHIYPFFYLSAIVKLGTLSKIITYFFPHATILPIAIPIAEVSTLNFLAILVKVSKVYTNKLCLNEGSQKK